MAHPSSPCVQFSIFPAHCTPLRLFVGWVWVLSSGPFIRLCDRIQRGHQHNMVGLHAAVYLSYKISCVFRPVYSHYIAIFLDRLQNKYKNCKGIKNNTNFGKLLEYKRDWIRHLNGMPCNRLPRVMKRNSTTGRRNHDRPLKRLLGTWDRNGSTSGPTPWQIYDDDDDDD